jgi:NDP-sugar pyrophosphorylase family protein
MNNKKNFNALVLAAGFGTRLRPVTGTKPKPMVTLCNKPLLGRIIDKLRGSGVSEIAVNTHYMPETIEEYIKGSEYSGFAEIFYEPDILGTGGPVINAREFLTRNGDFILHNGDIVSDIDINAMLDFHARGGYTATMAVMEGPENRVRVSADSNVVDILDNLDYYQENTRKLTYCGIMVLSPGIYDFLPEEPVNCSIVLAVLKAVDQCPGTVGAFVCEGNYWNDMGNLKQYFNAHEDILLKDKMSFDDISTSESRSDCFLFADEKAVISEKAVLSGFLCAGEGAVVEDDAFVCKCVLLENARVTKGEFRYNEIIGADFSRHRDWQSLKGLKILERYDLERCRISSLVEQGSDRGFFRISSPGGTEVLMHSSAVDEDFQRYIETGNFLAGINMQTPEIIEFDNSEYSILMEDLGNDTVYKMVSGMSGEDLSGLYRKIIDALVHFQVGTSKILSKTGTCPEIRIFNLDYLRWETDYFRDMFLKEYLCLNELPEELGKELDSLAKYVFDTPRIFMHRDFQSQNILFKDGKARFVDFQGCRIGPLAYDIMSLVRDPYVEINESLATELTNYYFHKFTEKGGFELPGMRKPLFGDSRFYSVPAGLQRNMQALGAYSFLGLRKGKSEYLKFIPRGMKYLMEGIRNFQSLEFPFSLEALSTVCSKILTDRFFG